MKIVSLIFLLSLFLTGCASMSERVRNRFTESPKSHSFAADERATFAAARAALEDMGYRLVSGGPAQHKLEALSGLQSGGDAALRSTRQFQVAAVFVSESDGQTRVDAVVHELLESDSEQRPGLATSTPLAESPVYEEFFRGIARHLGALSASGERTGAE